MWNRICVCALKKQQYAQVALGIHVLRVKCNNRPEFGDGKIRVVLAQVHLSLFGVCFDLFLATGRSLRKAWKNDKEDCSPHRENCFSCPHAPSIRRTRTISLFPYPAQKTRGRRGAPSSPRRAMLAVLERKYRTQLTATEHPLDSPLLR